LVNAPGAKAADTGERVLVSPRGKELPPSCEPVERVPGAMRGNSQPPLLDGIAEISIEAYHSARRSVGSDGRVFGSHRSGDARQPMMSIEGGRVSMSCVKAVWKIAKRLESTPSCKGPVEGDNVEVRISISNDQGGRTLTSFVGAASPCEDARELRELFWQMEIGYW